MCCIAYNRYPTYVISDIFFSLSLWSDRWQRSRGSLLLDSLGDDISVEKVRDQWAKITDMEEGDFPPTQQDATMGFVSKMQGLTHKANNNSNNSSNKTGPVKQIEIVRVVSFISHPRF